MLSIQHSLLLSTDSEPSAEIVIRSPWKALQWMAASTDTSTGLDFRPPPGRGHFLYEDSGAHILRIFCQLHPGVIH